MSMEDWMPKEVDAYFGTDRTSHCNLFNRPYKKPSFWQRIKAAYNAFRYGA